MTNLQLFLACVAIWGSTWFAITFQLGSVAPEASVLYRFLLASLLLFAYCRARGLRLHFTMAEHGWMALFGIFMFSVQYIFVYHAEQHVVSGLVAVGYSSIPLLGMLGLRWFFGTPMTWRVAAGGVLGVVGIVLVFLPEFAILQSDGTPYLGALFTVLAVLAAATANLVAHRNHAARLPLWQTMAWGMLYATLFSLAIITVTGTPLTFKVSPAYLLSLGYLVIFGSILAFAGYLTLLERIGAARAGYVGVMVPIVALVISAAFEDFYWHGVTWAGVAIAVAGNAIVLHERREA